MRVKFRKGKQRKFIKTVLIKLYSPSLRALKQYGAETKYQTLKAYYNETRTLPESLFLDLCRLAEINPAGLNVKMLGENWGQKLGGSK